jgi:uncharacterized membrane protein YecN with MAPEG domain
MSEAVPLLDPRGEDGLPQRSDLAKIPGRVLLFYATLNSIFLGIGVGSACLIDRYLPDSKVESKIRLLADYDLGWLYLAVFLLKFVPNAINAVVAARRKEARANNPDQHVYRVYTAPGAPALPYVLMETEGDVGRFNRAQRAAGNYLEYLPGQLATSLLAGFVYPLPVFIVSVIYVVSRITMTLRYSEEAKGRTPSYATSRIVAVVVDGLLLLAAFKALVY